MLDTIMKDVHFVLFTLCLALPVAIQAPSESRIVNGTQAAPGEFPYIASVQLWNDEHMCSGFIYSNYHVVTAASCVHGKVPTELKVVVGLTSLITVNDATQTVGVYKVDMHPSFNALTKANDVAIIKLASTLFFNTYVQHILYDEVDFAIPTGITMGWGAIEDGGLVAINLRKTTLSFKPSIDCQNTYGAVEFSQNYMICAGNDNASPCMYDEGSPLVQNGIVVGIMSRNKGCATPYSPSVYTRLSAYYSWLLRYAGTQPPLPNTPYPTPSTTAEPTSSITTTFGVPTAPCINCASTTQEVATSEQMLETTTQFAIPTAPCVNCPPVENESTPMQTTVPPIATETTVLVIPTAPCVNCPPPDE